MKTDHVDAIVNAVLYEGHILYPYRPTSVKNRRRFTFGRVYPRAFSRIQAGRERCTMTTQCLVEVPEVPGGRLNGSAGAVGSGAELEIGVRFIQPIDRQVFDAEEEPVARLVIDGTTHFTWQDVMERMVEVPKFNVPGPDHGVHEFTIPSFAERDELRDGPSLMGAIERRGERLEGTVSLAVEPVGDGIFKVTVDVANESACPDEIAGNQDAVLLRTFASTHTILRIHGGRFLSLTDPPTAHADAVASCSNDGTWPVLVGNQGQADTMLSSPIILYDYPQIAPESAGDLFDSTEIDEILTLRIMTMTDDEKDEMRNVDGFARRILHRTETLDQDDLFDMHGTFRDLRSMTEMESPTWADVRGRRYEVGDRVRIRPQGRSDVMDIALTGRAAEIESIEQDFEGRVYLALVVDDDPGRDLGFMRQPGHRFFYTTDDVEPLEEGRHEG